MSAGNMELDAPPAQEMSYANNVKKRYNEQGCLDACFFTMCCCFCCTDVCNYCCEVCNSCAECLGSCCVDTLSSCCSF